MCVCVCVRVCVCVCTYVCMSVYVHTYVHSKSPVYRPVHLHDTLTLNSYRLLTLKAAHKMDTAGNKVTTIPYALTHSTVMIVCVVTLLYVALDNYEQDGTNYLILHT